MIFRSGRTASQMRSLRLALRVGCCCVAFAAVSAARQAHASVIEGEGIIAILPSARWGGKPASLDNRGFAPSLTASFGLRPSASTELAIEIGGTLFGASQDAGRFDFVGMPLLLRGSYTPTPAKDLRPVFHAGVGKELVLVYGPDGKYQEHTPNVAMVAAGLQADLNDAIGLQADAGYLYARARAPGVGELDGGGVFVRAGMFFRWDPVRRLGR